MSNSLVPQASKSRGSALPHPLWIRLAAFLSLKAPNTKSTYEGILQEWCQFLKADPGTQDGARKLLKATDLHAIAYKAWLDSKPGEKPRAARSKSLSKEIEIVSSHRTKKVGLESTLSNATISKKFAALRRMYRVLIASNIGISDNPFDADRVPAPPKAAGRKRPTEMVDYKLVRAIVDAPDTKTDKGIQDSAILALFFGAGLRRSEVLGLRIGDVRKTPRGTVFLYLRSTKAKRDAEQALPPWAVKLLQNHLKRRLNLGAESGDYLFVSFRGRGGIKPTQNPLSPVGLYKMFKHYCTKAGAGGFLSPHSARATAITRLLDSGISHRDVQQFSRHSSIQMVELYDKRRKTVDENPAKDLDFE